jgi:tRNA A-37 threonylcarbamoyl transferase component Bud32
VLNTSLSAASSVGLLITLLVVASGFLTVFVWKWTYGSQERGLEREIAKGRYVNALNFFLEKGRYVDAGSLEEARGNYDRAAEYYERSGELDRAGDMYIACGDHGLAALVYRDAGMPEKAARSFMFQEKFEAAIPLWTKAGQHLRAAECWERLERPEDAASSYELGGAIDRAAGIWMECQDFSRAAHLYNKVGASTKAAQAFWKCGNVAGAAECLSAARDWVTLGRLWAGSGHPVRAIDALTLAETSDERFRPAWILKAQLEEQVGDAKATLATHQTLLEYDVGHGIRDDLTRRWILSMAQYHFRNYDYQVGLDMLARLQDLELMTPDLAKRVASLKEALDKQRADESTALIASLEVPSSERYEVITEVGRGGNGVIYRARDRSLDRIVAMKLIHRTSLNNQRALEWFMREAKTAASLNHPNIVTIFDLGAMDEQPYLAMEFVEGETLVQYIERTKDLPLSDALLEDLIRGLISALEYAHEANVVHLDIKLENVMFSKRGEVKLMDFGLARALNDAAEKSVISGTPLYMAPEQISGGQVDRRTDIYALGIMLYLLYTGSWPVGRDRPLYEHLYETPKDPREHRSDLSPEVAATLLACLEKSPDDRPQSVQEVGTRLLGDAF